MTKQRVKSEELRAKMPPRHHSTTSPRHHSTTSLTPHSCKFVPFVDIASFWVLAWMERRFYAHHSCKSLQLVD